MGDAIKKAAENPLAAIKDREERLLTRVESFTSKDVSEACRGMNEKILERVALMCERVGGSGENLSNAVLTVVNLSKHKDSKEETLNSIMEKLETSADSWFLHNAERLSQKVSPEQFLKSIPLLERISNWNSRAFTPSVMIDESKMILLTSEFLNAVGDDRIAQCVELGKECAERLIKPTDLYKALISIAKKNSSKEQFDTIVNEYSRLIPQLKLVQETTSRFFMDEPGDEKVFTMEKPEWTLSYLSEKASSLTLEEFTKFLTNMRKERELNALYSKVEPNEEMVVVIGRHSYRPDLVKYEKLLDRFTKLLDEAETPNDPKLADLKEAFKSSVNYTDEYSSEVCKTALEKWKRRAEKWHNKEIAERLIPNELGILLSRMSAIHEPEGTDAAKLMEALSKNNIKFKVSTELWPKDRNAQVMDRMGRNIAYIRNIPSELPRGMFIGEGGASVPGPGFIIFADSVEPSQINALKTLQDERISTYRLPTGYITLRLPASNEKQELAGREVLLETMHIDTVISIIPGTCTRDGRPILLADPHYYREINENPNFKGEFERLLKEQGLKDRVVVIPEEEAHLNVANIALVKKGMKDFIIINEAGKTIDLLVEKGLEKERVIPVKVEEMHAFRGSIGCCISQVKAEEVIEL